MTKFGYSLATPLLLYIIRSCGEQGSLNVNVGTHPLFIRCLCRVVHFLMHRGPNLLVRLRESFAVHYPVHVYIG